MAEIDILKSVPYLINAPSPQIWSDYDGDTDTLYLSFAKPQRANDSVMQGNVIYHYRNELLVGLTVLHASETAIPGDPPQPVAT